MTWGIIVVRSKNFVHFLEELKMSKRHYKINRPLANAKIHISFTFDNYFFVAFKINKNTKIITPQNLGEPLGKKFNSLKHQGTKKYIPHIPHSPRNENWWGIANPKYKVFGGKGFASIPGKSWDCNCIPCTAPPIPPALQCFYQIWRAFDAPRVDKWVESYKQKLLNSY